MKMEDNKYNGWTNRETWLVNLHFNPESKEDLERIKEEIDELEESIQNMFLRDYVDFSKIDWYDLEKSMPEETDVEVSEND
jgi:hypothetical protein